MLSRRNIRVKVMQLLYWMGRDPKVSRPELFKQYFTSVNQSFELFLYSLLGYMEIAAYSRIDAKNRAAKHLQTEEDKAFRAHLVNNPYFQSLSSNKDLIGRFNSLKLKDKIDKDLIRMAYMEFARTKQYIQYAINANPTPAEHKQQLLNLLKTISKMELYVGDLEDKYENWVDDESLISGTLKRTIKALPLDSHFLEELMPNDETVKIFGENLLRKTIEKDKELLNLIEPVLKNWDAERVAIIDMILLKMALAEFLYFPTIPTKVTLNEFVELAKTYSTEKSKEFVNGILDRLLKTLTEQDQIHKEGRGLIE